MKLSDKEITSWLHERQRESWELELLITGFSIVLLFLVPEYCAAIRESILARTTSTLTVPLLVSVQFVSITSMVITVNLVAYVITRGIWVGYVGLSSVPSLHGAAKKLEEDRSFITTLDKLDKFASSIFAFSFLIGAFVLSICSYILFLFVIYSGLKLFLHIDEHAVIFGLVVTLYLLSPIMVMLGNLPRIPYISVFTAPITKVYRRAFSYFTLFVFYRALYQKVRLKFGGLTTNVIVCSYIVVITALSSAYKDSQQKLFTEDSVAFKPHRYDNLRSESKAIMNVSISQDVISDRFLKLFFRHSNDIYRAVLNTCNPELTVPNTIDISIFDVLHSKEASEMQKTAQTYLACIPNVLSVRIDGSQHQINWYFTHHQNFGEPGYVAYIDVAGLVNGPHLLTITETLNNEESKISIPFIKASD